MKITAIMILASISALAAQAEATHPEVIVCIESNTGFVVAENAKAFASKMFAAIGVSIQWRRGLDGCPPQGLQISLSNQTPSSLLPGALAYALPFEGTHICVFWDRIARKNPRVLPHLLAHVLAHEIAHILQGTRDHARQGMMKARWTDDDFESMLRKPLEFTSDEAVQIRAGAAVRTTTPDAATIVATPEQGE